MIRILLASALLLAAWVAPGPGGGAWTGDGRALAQGIEVTPFAPVLDITPLGPVLRAIEQRYPGRALDAQVREGDDRPLYRIKWLGNDGKVRDITADARSGEILRVR